MGAPVRIDDQAFSDLRFDVLATACHLADADHARGKMCLLWRQCTAQGAYVLSESIVCAVLGERGSAGLVESNLGERVEDGIRIKGTKGRIEWLKKLRKNASKGGRAKAAKSLPNGRAEASSGLASDCPLTPTLITTPTKKERAKTKQAVPADWQPTNPIGLNASEHLELERFRNHHRAKGNTFVDIDAAWSNWLSRSREYAAARPANGSRVPEQVRHIPDLTKRP